MDPALKYLSLITLEFFFIGSTAKCSLILARFPSYWSLRGQTSIHISKASPGQCSASSGGSNNSCISSYHSTSIWRIFYTAIFLFAGKCVHQQFDVDAKFCCIKNPSDGSGVIAADPGIVGTFKGGTTCPGDSLEMCIKVCPSSNARLYGACVRGCAGRCPSRYMTNLLKDYWLKRVTRFKVSF